VSRVRCLFVCVFLCLWFVVPSLSWRTWKLEPNSWIFAPLLHWLPGLICTLFCVQIRYLIRARHGMSWTTFLKRLKTIASFIFKHIISTYFNILYSCSSCDVLTKSSFKNPKTEIPPGWISWIRLILGSDATLRSII
jgi:hypothetical protein